MTEIEQALKALKLFGMATAYAEIVAQASHSPLVDDLLRQLIEAEQLNRHLRSIRYQFHSAKFPVHRGLAGFDFADAKVDKIAIDQLASAQIIAAAQNVVLAGGTGKTHLAIALGLKAINDHNKWIRGRSGHPTGTGGERSATKASWPFG